uniref:Secreted protein n=1 Tax=Streptomyces sp. NBC_00049 TaxID=2903617 RepID=A0AAU2JPP5_9ACTN
MSLALLLTAAAATAVGAAALHAVHGLRKQVTALRSELAVSAHPRAATVPHARSAVESPAAEIRAAVAEALAEERERELAEARAFWAAQEARDAADAPSLLGGLPGLGDDGPAVFLPRQADLVGLEPVLGEDLLDEYPAYPEDSAELAAARRRHPSHPDFVPVQASHPGADHERTVSRLEELAEARTALADVRPGPLGTLDVYVFTDGTTLCMTPGHRETAERLAEALRSGTAPVLLGGSGISGAYALTFSCGDSEDPDDNVYILADRVIASL